MMFKTFKMFYNFKICTTGTVGLRPLVQNENREARNRLGSFLPFPLADLDRSKCYPVELIEPRPAMQVSGGNSKRK
jgi:hypothetical protein